MQKFFAIASLSLVILLTSTNLVAGQIEKPGQCPNVTFVNEFVLKDFLGDWYVFEKYPAVFVTDGQSCLKAQYNDLGNNQITVFLSQLNKDGDELTRDGAGVLVGPGKFLVVISGPSGTAYEYNVIQTDYDSYAVMYSCKQLEGKYQQFAWVLTRVAQPSVETEATAEAALIAQNIDTLALVKENQENC